MEPMLLPLAMLGQIPTVPATPGTAMDFTWLFLKMLLILAIVCIIAVLILKYAVPHVGLMSRLRRGGFVTIHGRHHLDPRASLCLVEIGKRYLVLGVTDHGINPIVELSEGEFRELTKRT
jgi:flagellar biosynthetic protein FliO